MGKQKTHKASSKVFKKKSNGTLTYKKSNGNHKTSKDSAKQVGLEMQYFSFLSCTG